MKTGGHRGVSRAFTLPEVALAVGIIAFGLVAIFSVLPFGISAQKDNREETIIRYEAEFWFAVLQAGGAPLSAMDRVETVELTDNLGAVHRIHRQDLVPPNPGNPQHVSLAEEAKGAWARDVCGWLSAPDFVLNGATPPAQDPRVPAKFARVWAVNGSLYDRLYSLRGKGGHFLDGGEFAFSYFIETHIEPVQGAGTRITLTFHWPISQPIEEALESGQPMAEIVKNKTLRPANSKSFTILTTQRPRPVLSNANLNARQFQFMRVALTGEAFTIADLKAKFPDRYSAFPWDGYPRRLSLKATGEVRIQIFNPTDKTWRFRGEPEIKALEPRVGEAFHPLHDPGLNLHIDGYNTSYSIRSVAPNGHFLALIGSGFTPTPAGVFPGYRVSFLGKSEAWEAVLSDYQKWGLIKRDNEKYRMGELYNSPVLRLLQIARPGVPAFNVTLGPHDYWPAGAPTAGTACSFWVLQ